MIISTDLGFNQSCVHKRNSIIINDIGVIKQMTYSEAMKFINLIIKLTPPLPSLYLPLPLPIPQPLPQPKPLFHKL